MFTSTIANEKNHKKRLMIKSAKLTPNRLAIIDLGTNSVRIDIYRLTGRKVIRVYRGKLMVRLGDGVFSTGKLSPIGMERTIRAFSQFRQLLLRKKVKKVIAFGTSALRTATNSKEFLQRLKVQTGINVKVISGKEEGQLIALGVLANIEPPKGYYSLVDIGGGSTEISLCLGKKIIYSYSFQLGANRLQQTFLKTIPPEFKRGQLHPILALRQHLKSELHPFSQFCAKYQIKMILGSSGTIRSIERIMEKAGRKRKNISRSAVSAFVSELQTMNRVQIKKIPGLEEKRVDLILAGSILLEEIMFAVGTKKLAVTDLALRDGILERELAANGTS